MQEAGSPATPTAKFGRDRCSDVCDARGGEVKDESVETGREA